MPEIVYVLVNEAMPGICKVGCTTIDLARRIRELFSTGVPLPFELFYACEVESCTFVERQIHEAFGDHRLSSRREFFRIAPERVRAALMIAAKREIRLGDDEVFETKEDKADVEVAKRRSRFKLSMLGIPPGTVLKLAKDENLTCTTVDDSNKVLFKESVTSLSDAALQAVTELGFNWPSASGPWEWTFEGKRLEELRRELDERAD